MERGPSRALWSTSVQDVRLGSRELGEDDGGLGRSDEEEEDWGTGMSSSVKRSEGLMPACRKTAVNSGRREISGRGMCRRGW